MRLSLSACSALYSERLERIEGDIPGRAIYFGKVEERLPEIRDPEFNIRACRLAAWAAEDMARQVGAAVSRYGRDRIAIVLGASNTGVDEAQANIDAALSRSGDCRCGFPDGFRFSMLELGSPSEYLARKTGITGPCYTISTAGSSSAKAFPSSLLRVEA